jgi:redox-sensitive bicupin YhaK (pirin superfamily)
MKTVKVNKHIVSAGDIQRMNAGSGVMHCEYNASKKETIKFSQIWIQPNKMVIKPSYEQKKIPHRDPLTPLVTGKGAKCSLSLIQDASSSRLVLTEQVTFKQIFRKRPV